MFVLQVYTEERGWRFVSSVWEDEVGWCYIDSPEQPDRHATVEAAEQDARDVAAESEVRTAVFDEKLGIRVYECAPPERKRQNPT